MVVEESSVPRSAVFKRVYGLEASLMVASFRFSAETSVSLILLTPEAIASPIGKTLIVIASLAETRPNRVAW